MLIRILGNDLSNKTETEDRFIFSGLYSVSLVRAKFTFWKKSWCYTYAITVTNLANFLSPSNGTKLLMLEHACGSNWLDEHLKLSKKLSKHKLPKKCVS